MTLPRSDLDHTLRAKGIGSSEIAMLIPGDDGKPLSPFGGPHKLWRKKTGQELPEDDTPKPWLARGKFLEPAILSWYEHKTGNYLRRSPGTRQSKRWPVVIDSADGLVWMPGNDSNKPDAALEAKTSFWWMRGDWGEDGTDQVPPYYLLQGQWHMIAWGLDRCVYPAFWGDDLHIYETRNDDELALALVSVAEKFWRDHVETGVAPPVDATDGTSEWLARRLKQSTQDVVEADAGVAAKLLEFREASLTADAAGARAKLLANEIKAVIGEHSGLHLPGEPKASVKFNEVKGRASFDSDGALAKMFEDREAILAALHSADPSNPMLAQRWPGLAELRDEHTKAGAPYRRFTKTGLMKFDPDGGSKDG